MPAPRGGADYDALAHVAQRFNQQSAALRESAARAKQCLDGLQGGDWVGQVANQFYVEKNASVLPTLQRLVPALENGAQATLATRHIMQAADDEAARYLTAQGDGAGPRSMAGASAFVHGGGPFGPLARGAAAQSGGPSTVAGAAASAAAAALGAVRGLGTVANAATQAMKAAADTAAVLEGTIKVDDAPLTLTLPGAFNRGMRSAWRESFPGGKEREQGGLLVQNKDGSYEWIGGKPGKPGSWPINDDGRHDKDDKRLCGRRI